MKAFVINKPGEFQFVEMDDPYPSTGEVRLKVSRIGLCGSDLTTWRGLNPMVTYPRIIGHEISGIIEEVGEEVPSNIITGQQVALIPYSHCGKCSSCLKGRINACKNNQTMGVQRDGGSSEYIVTPWDKLIFADDLSPEELVMVEPLSVGFHAVKRGRVTEKDTVAIFGCGMIGLGAIFGSAAWTEKVVAIDIAEEKLTLAHEVGAKHVINSATMNLHHELNEITNGNGPDVMIEAVGLPQTFKEAVEEVAFAGRVVYIGYTRENVEYETRYFVMKEIDIMGSRNADREDFDAVIEMIRQGTSDINNLITKKVSFDEMGEALNEWSNDPLSVTKIVVDMQEY